MPITIGDLSFNTLSGPVSLSVLVPNFELFSFNDLFIPILVLLGDEHTNRIGICEPNEDNLSIFTPLWLRLIDSWGSENLKIDYFVEGNFPIHLLSSSYYLSDELKNWSYEVSNDNTMSYIPIYHPECFSNIDSIKENCITNFTNYHYADLRLGISLSKIKHTDSEPIQTNVLKFIKTIYPNKWKNKRSHERKQKIYKESTNDYESVIYNTIEAALSINRSTTHDHLAEIGNINILSFIKLVYEDPIFLSKIIFNINNKLINKTSKLFSVLHSVKIEQINTYISYFQQYFIYVIKIDSDLEEIKSTLYEGIEIYNKDVITIKAYNSIKSRNRKILKKTNKMMYEEEVINAKYNKLLKRIKKYNIACEKLATTIMIPFNDMFVLFKSWNSNSLLSIYNAGDAHCKYLSSFLQSVQLYTTHTFTHHSDQMYITKYKENVSSFKRCLDFKNKDLNIDSLIIDNIFQQPNFKHKEEVKNRVELNAKRINILGVELYKEMLSGKIITYDILNSKCKNLESKNDCIKELQFENLTINGPKEYMNKVKL